MFSNKPNLKKLNKKLIKALDEPPTEVYDRAKEWYDEVVIQNGQRSSEDAELALDWLPRENETSINIRVNKDLIRNDKRIAKLISVLYDLSDKID